MQTGQYSYENSMEIFILFIENYQYPANHDALEDIFCIPECSKQVVKESSRQLSIIQKNYKELSRTDQNYDWVC